MIFGVLNPEKRPNLPVIASKAKPLKMTLQS